MNGGLVVSLFLILVFSASNSLPSAANTSNPTTTPAGRQILEVINHTYYSTAWNPYELRPPPPIYHSPWLPPEGFYSHFDPWIADIIMNRIHDILADWRSRNLPPLYHCRYTCEQYTPRKISRQAHKNPTPPPSPSSEHKNPTPQHVEENPTPTMPMHNNATTPPPPNNSEDKCPTMTRVIETCTNMRQHDSVNYAFSWSCTYSDDCCKATLNVSNECLNLNPTINWIKSICCPSSITTPAGGKSNA